MPSGEFVDYLNGELRQKIGACLFQGGGEVCRGDVMGGHSPFWTRELFDCEVAEATVRLLPNVSHLVVGHTVQERGIRFHCAGDALVAIDCGLSKALSPRGARLEFVEIIHHHNNSINDNNINSNNCQRTWPSLSVGCNEGGGKTCLSGNSNKSPLPRATT